MASPEILELNKQDYKSAMLIAKDEVFKDAPDKLKNIVELQI